MDILGSQQSQRSDIDVLSDVSDLIRQALPLEVNHRTEGTFLLTRKSSPDQSGIRSIRGVLESPGIIKLRIEFLRTKRDLRIPLQTLCKHLSSLSEKTHLAPPEQEPEGDWISLGLELTIQATPVSLARATALLHELSRIETVTKELKAELPEVPCESDLINQYSTVADILEPVLPGEAGLSEIPANHAAWGIRTADYLSSCFPVAIVAPDSITEGYCLRLLAGACRILGKSLGRLLLPAVNAKSLIELSKKAPGAVVVPASRISLGTSIYEMGNEMLSLMEALVSMDTPFVFTGTQELLQQVFHGGQGGMNNPCMPVVCHSPEISLDVLTKFAMELLSRKMSGLSVSDRTAVTRSIMENLSSLPSSTARCILPSIARREVLLRLEGRPKEFPSTKAYVSDVAELTETLSGVAAKNRVSRPQHIQEKLIKVFAADRLSCYLKDHLFAQDRALEALALRLKTECLTRPDYQPLRYCAQGMPATGKSQSAILIARLLDVPYINIDAASMPDYYTAAAQLLGSGRGIVGSHKSGRLEEVSKHHTGALVEVSDLDHAVPNVREALADLFLQVLETGEAQSATGAMFSCANLIFAFTINLPNGLDEGIYRSVGFTNVDSGSALHRRVVKEIKGILSSAFLSRVGTPILFEPLTGEALAHIVTGAIHHAVRTASARLHLNLTSVTLSDDVVPAVLASVDSCGKSMGARGIVEHVRNLVAEGFTAFAGVHHDPIGVGLYIRLTENCKQLILQVENSGQMGASNE